MSTRPILTAIAAVLALTLSAPCASAQEVDDDITKALKDAYLRYTAGELSEAEALLVEATEKIREKRSEALTGSFFPDESAGWEGGEITSDAGNGDLGGITGLTMSRTYTRGDDQIAVKVTVDSPLIARLAPLLNNPNAIAFGGGEVERVKGNTAMFKDGELTYVHDDRLHVVLSTAAGEPSKRQMITLAGDFDYDAIDAIVDAEREEERPRSGLDALRR